MAAPAPPPPTLAEAEALTPQSDFARFVKSDVDPQVKNLAMKKLFADPHFNIMDGLDTYIDDYNTPDPLPRSILRQLVQARTLGLLDDELEAQPAPDGLGDEVMPMAPAQAVVPPGGEEVAHAQAEAAAADALPVSMGAAAVPDAAAPDGDRSVTALARPSAIVVPLPLPRREGAADPG